MRIARCQAIPLNLEMTLAAGSESRRTHLSCVVVRLDTDEGLVGCGFTAITEEEVVAAAINEIAAPALVGMDPVRARADLGATLLAAGAAGPERLCTATRSPRSIWRYGSCGRRRCRYRCGGCWAVRGAACRSMPRSDSDSSTTSELVAAARDWAGRGFSRLKMTVGHHGLQRRDEPRPLATVIREDERRVRAVREAVGPEVEICIDANCSLDPWHAGRLARRLEDVDIAFFEEPITQNDVRALADLRSRTRIPLAAGQNEGLASRASVDFCQARALDVLQPNAWRSPAASPSA